SMSNSTAFPLASAHARAMSPSIAAVAAALGAGTSAAGAKASESSIRRQAYEKAISIQDLVTCVPASYREHLHEHIQWTADMADKLAKCMSSLRKLESAKADSVTPSHLLLKVPVLQACKEYREYGGGLAAASAIENAVADAQASVLDAAIQHKRGEKAYLEALLTPEALLDRYKNPVNARWSDLRERSKVPRFSYVGGSSALQNTDVTVAEWVVNPVVIKEYEDLLTDLYPIALRAITIVEMKEYALSAKIEKKKAVAKTADVEMAEATKPGPSIQSLVDKSVQGRVKQLEAQIKKVS
ncbi:hypothetical protein BC628DRAFT_1442814, partial [Trametes gibbosa]